MSLWLRRLLLVEWSGLAAAIVAGAGALAFIAPNFLTEFNLYVMLRSLSVPLLVAFAQMITLGVGQMNIAVGAIGGLVAIAFGGMMEVYGVPLGLAIPLALAIGALSGLIKRPADRAHGNQRLHHYAGDRLGLHRNQFWHYRIDSILQNAAGPERVRRPGIGARCLICSSRR